MSKTLEMSSNLKVDELLCSTSKSKDHYVSAPVMLQCGHLVCRSCINNTPINCMKCVTQQQQLTTTIQNRVNLMTYSYEENLNELFVQLVEQTKKKVEEFKGLLEGSDETADVHFQYVQDEIEIRVESIKIQLEEHLDKFKNDLQKMKDDFKSSRQWLADFEVDSLKSYQESCIELQQYCDNKQIQNYESLFEFQDNLEVLELKIKEFQENVCNFELKFKPSSDIVAKDLIGKVEFLRGAFMSNVNEGREKEKFETIEVYKKIRDICFLPNRKLLCATDESLRIYDSDFRLIKEILEVTNVKFKPLGIAVCLQNERIYLSNGADTLIMMDLEFNMLKKQSMFRDGQFHGLCYKNDYLYVCDKSFGRIRIYDSELGDVQTSMKLNYEPYYVATSDHVIAVSGSDGLYFYDLANRGFKRKHTTVYGRVSEQNSQFYVLENRLMKTHVFDPTGIMIDTLDHGTLNIKLEYVYDGQVFFIDEKLYINCYDDRKILYFLK